MKLQNIEARIIQIKQEIAKKPKELASPIPQALLDKQITQAVQPLNEELEQLQLERQFILDKRENIFWKTMWNIVVPVIVSLATTYLVIKLGLF